MEQTPNTQEKIAGIYKIQNKINGKVYIGQSIDIYKRWAQHKYNANYESQLHKPLYRSLKKYGIENFTFEIIKETYDLDYYEKFFIKLYRSQNIKYGYNLEAGGEGGWQYINEEVKLGLRNHPMKGHIWTEKQRKTMSKGRKGKYKSEEHYFAKMTEDEKKKFVKEKCGTFTAPWWHKGDMTLRSFDCPGEGWEKGYGRNMISEEGMKKLQSLKWWTDGKNNKRSLECPGDSWTLGRTYSRKQKPVK